MASGGVTVEIDSLKSLAEYLDGLVGATGSGQPMSETAKTYPVLSANFGGSPDANAVAFPPAHNLTGKYNSAARDLLAGVSTLEQHIGLLAAAARILHDKYDTVEKAGAASAADIRAALNTAGTAMSSPLSTGGGLPA